MSVLKYLFVFFIITTAYSQEDVFNFTEVDEIPYFVDSECNIKSEECFKTELQKHIQRVFSYPKNAFENGIEGKVYVQFKISKEGHVTEVKARSKDSLFKNEGIRIINSLPKFSPAYIKEIPVSTTYSHAIHFDIKESEKIKSYEEVFIAPKISERCKGKVSGKECFKKDVLDFIYDNLKHKNLNLSKNYQRSIGKIEFIAKCYFEISTSGLIQNLIVISNEDSMKHEIERAFEEKKLLIIPAKNEEGTKVPCYFSDEIKIVAVTREVKHPILGYQ